MDEITIKACAEVQNAIKDLEHLDFSTAFQQRQNSSLNQVQDVALKLLKTCPEYIQKRVWNEFF